MTVNYYLNTNQGRTADSIGIRRKSVHNFISGRNKIKLGNTQIETTNKIHSGTKPQEQILYQSECAVRWRSLFFMQIAEKKIYEALEPPCTKFNSNESSSLENKPTNTHHHIEWISPIYKHLADALKEFNIRRFIEDLFTFFPS